MHNKLGEGDFDDFGELPWQNKELPRHYNNFAVDNIEIRPLFRTESASVIHGSLPPSATSIATGNIEINEIFTSLQDERSLAEARGGG